MDKVIDLKQNFEQCFPSDLFRGLVQKYEDFVLPLINAPVDCRPAGISMNVWTNLIVSSTDMMEDYKIQKNFLDFFSFLIGLFVKYIERKKRKISNSHFCNLWQIL